MLPIRDLNPTRTRPVLTWLLIAVNVAIYLYQWLLAPSQVAFIQRFGVVPYYLVHAPWSGSWVTPLTSMFLHGSLWHLLGNIWFLFVFGDNIEDRLGKVRYLVFYGLAGLGAVALQVAVDPMSKVPMIGASGAIAGVLGGYMVLFPRARVLTLVPIFIFITFVELRAFWLLGIWFAYQLLMGLLETGMNTVGGVAFFAHVGGFAAGLLLIKPFDALAGGGPDGGRPSRRRRGGTIEPEWRRSRRTPRG